MATHVWQPEELKLFVRKLGEILGEYAIFSGYRHFIPIPDDLAIAKMLAMVGLDPESEVIAKGFNEDGPLLVFPNAIDFPSSMEHLQLREVGFKGPCGHSKKPILVLLVRSKEFYWGEEECRDCWVRTEEFLGEAGFSEVPKE